MGQIPQDAANDLGAEEFECKICYSPYSLGSRRPKVLQCGHRLCARCLTKILDQGESPPRSVACPFCRRATSLPSETVGGLPDDGGIVAVLAPQLRGRLDLQHGSTELLLSPHHLNTLVEPFPSPSPGCLVITIMESAGPQQDPRSPPGRQDRRSSSLDSMASMAHRWTPWNCTVRLCQVLARALVWLLGLLYFSSLPLGVYLLIMQKTTLGILLVVACYRQLSSCVGGSTDSMLLRSELRQTRERAQQLALAGRQLLTARLRDKALPQEERLEMELLWVAFSSSLELFHSDMCKVYSLGQSFLLSSGTSTLVQTGIQGGMTEVTARALSLPQLNCDEPTASVEGLEQGDLKVETSRVDQMIEDMEQKVNVLRWTVEARGPQYAEPLSTEDGSSLALLSTDVEDHGQQYERNQLMAMLLVGSVTALGILLFICVVYLV
ncbi:E3 ubiquitin-protein ligase RNF182-like [Arapaima gigas]